MSWWRSSGHRLAGGLIERSLYPRPKGKNETGVGAGHRRITSTEKPGEDGSSGA